MLLHSRWALHAGGTSDSALVSGRGSSPHLLSIHILLRRRPASKLLLLLYWLVIIVWTLASHVDAHRTRGAHLQSTKSAHLHTHTTLDTTGRYSSRTRTCVVNSTPSVSIWSTKSTWSCPHTVSTTATSVLVESISSPISAPSAEVLLHKPTRIWRPMRGRRNGH